MLQEYYYSRLSRAKRTIVKKSKQIASMWTDIDDGDDSDGIFYNTW